MKPIEKALYINSMRRLLKPIYTKFSDFLVNNKGVGSLIYTQHKYFPMPIFLFDLLFRFKLLKYLFNFYGYHVFLSSYSKRDGDNNLYWLSRESLYWHLWRQSDHYEKSIIDIMSLDEIEDYLKNDDLIVLEPGFGIGKTYFRNYNLLSHFKKYIALEINPFCFEYINK
jgi:hypothetical protein